MKQTQGRHKTPFMKLYDYLICLLCYQRFPVMFVFTYSIHRSSTSFIQLTSVCSISCFSFTTDFFITKTNIFKIETVTSFLNVLKHFHIKIIILSFGTRNSLSGQNWDYVDAVTHYRSRLTSIMWRVRSTRGITTFSLEGYTFVPKTCL